MANFKGANMSHVSQHCRLNLLLSVFVQKTQNSELSYSMAVTL